MTREWQAGDVALVTTENSDRERLAVRGVTSGTGTPCWWFPDRQTWTDSTSRVRALAVIDPDDRAAIEHLRNIYDREVIVQNGDTDPRRVTPAARANAMQQALRNLADPGSNEPLDPAARVACRNAIWARVGEVWVANGFGAMTWERLTRGYPVEVQP